VFLDNTSALPATQPLRDCLRAFARCLEDIGELEFVRKLGDDISLISREQIDANQVPISDGFALEDPRSLTEECARSTGHDESGGLRTSTRLCDRITAEHYSEIAVRRGRYLIE